MGKIEYPFSAHGRELELPPSFAEATKSSSADSSSFDTPGLACISFFDYNRLRLHNFPTALSTSVQLLCEDKWAARIKLKDCKAIPLGREIRFHGGPWADHRHGKSQVIVRQILEHLYDEGWVLKQSLNMCRSKESDSGGKQTYLEVANFGKTYSHTSHTNTDTVFFSQKQPPPPPCDWLCLSTDARDRLKIQEAPPPDLAMAILAMLGDKVQSLAPAGQDWEIKFKGWPFASFDRDGQKGTQLLMASLLDKMEEFGFVLYGKVDIHGGDYPDTLFFVRPKGWVAGQPLVQFR